MEDKKQDKLTDRSKLKNEKISQEELNEEETSTHGFQTSLNEELSDKIKENPNKFIGCGG